MYTLCIHYIYNKYIYIYICVIEYIYICIYIYMYIYIYIYIYISFKHCDVLKSHRDAMMILNDQADMLVEITREI